MKRGCIVLSYTDFSSNIIIIILVFFTLTVAEKNFLESETGLKIEQAGVGEVYDTRINMDPLSSCGKFPL